MHIKLVPKQDPKPTHKNKVWCCLDPTCQRYYSRRGGLMQHLKVIHKYKTVSTTRKQI
ncbi:hypothetical protein BJY04DRAFT_187587 [Aspergillus karnatakaensis]|uniref:uncharacterized protein n=1 Tax=Aspergillus karnatakaensis TaxID=1810916 RepID=UPI003CCD3D21